MRLVEILPAAVHDDDPVGTELADEPIILNSFAFEVKNDLLGALLFLRRQAASGTAHPLFWIGAFCIN
ncbi:7896978e-c7b5-4628-a61c-d00eb2e6fd0c [Thermothielavioides terrestris]|uniref:7896978e-c7b5-4628-a61c-d00eb2e6fd0c n=1 Tax=Thermothielavioides terrestris TaxID=2587410 RepID=A0A446BBU3_9PEZI|nr:7896978e-c7b5-4628-a61c-d00eb2e6fd0c [Thermothielavioides terrestris]